MAEVKFELKTLKRATFEKNYVVGNKTTALLWNLTKDSTFRRTAADTMVRWTDAGIRDGTSHLWQWVYFDHPARAVNPDPEQGALEACCYWNWQGACNPTSGKTHNRHRHHCCICGSLDHGAIGSLTHVNPRQCSKLKQYQDVIAELARITGQSASNLVEFFGFGKDLPDTIEVNVPVRDAPPKAKPQRHSAWSTASSPKSDGSASPTTAAAAPETSAAAPLLPYTKDTMAVKVTKHCLPDAVSPAQHNKILHRWEPVRGEDEPGRGLVVFWCECNTCRLTGAYRNEVFRGGFFPRQHEDSKKEMDPIPVVVKTFTDDDTNKRSFLQELLTYECLGRCAPRPCAPLIAYGCVKCPVAEGENPTFKNFVAVQSREMSLSNFILSQGGNLELCLKVARGLVKAVAACHENGVFHRDLKPANVLVHDPLGACQVELIDFEGSLVTDAQSQRSVIMTPVWMMSLFWQKRAGLLQQIGPDTRGQRADAWALGMILYELLRGCTGCAPSVESDPGHKHHKDYIDAMGSDQWRPIPLIVRDSFMKRSPDGRTLPISTEWLPLSAVFSFENECVIPPATHPLLRDLLIRVMGFDGDGKTMLHHSKHTAVDAIACGHVAVLPFSEVLERLNTLKNSKTDSDRETVRKCRNALAHSEHAPYKSLWRESCIGEYDHTTKTFAADDPRRTVAEALVEGKLAFLAGGSN